MVKEKKQSGRRNVDTEKSHAEELFISTELSQERIAQIVGVTPKTLSGWVNADEGRWKTLRAASSITKGSIVSMLLQQLDNLLRTIRDRKDGDNFPTSTEADTISKIAGQVEKLEKKNNLSLTIQVLDEFLEFYFKRKPELAKELAPFTLEFAKEKAKTLNG